jgi:sugar-specific transcriptional regulator TrmB
MYDELLTKAGLTKEQALIYQTLLKNGFAVASRLAGISGLKRALTYKIIQQLMDLGLVEKREDIGKVALFFPAHPGKIRELLAKKEEEIKAAEAAFTGIIGKLSSDWNLLSGKPNVQFFEGDDGVWSVLNDSLTATETVDAYSDIESIEKYIPKINKEYVEKRRKEGIKKRGLILDTPRARQLLKDYNPDITENRFISCQMTPPTTQTILQIYDNKISYISLDDKMSVGTIIESPHIYSLHKYLYQCLWEIAKPDERQAKSDSVATVTQ